MRTFVLLFCAALILGGAPLDPARAQSWFDVQSYVNHQVAIGQKRIVLPAGRYYVRPQNQTHLTLNNLHGITLVGINFEMVCSQTTCAMVLRNCSNVMIEGMLIDYDPLPYTQGRIISMSADKSRHVVQIFPGYPAANTVYNFKYEIFRPDTRTLRCSTYYPQSIQVLDSTHFAVNKGSGSPSDSEQIGDIVAIASAYAPGGSMPHAVQIQNCSNVTMNGLSIYASNCFGYYETNCSGNTYLNCTIDRCPINAELVTRGDPRVRSLNADAFHSVGATVGPSLLNCTARFMGDDGVSIRGSYSMVMSASGNTLRVLEKETVPQAGDTVELWSYDGIRLPDATVVSVASAGQATRAERAFVQQQYIDPGIKAQELINAYRVTLNRAVSLPMGSVLSSKNRAGSGFMIQDCWFGYNRSRGIVVKASNGTVTGNTLIGNWLPAILVSPEYYFLESGLADSVSITNNAIYNCVTTALDVDAASGSGATSQAGAHNNLTISGNIFTSCPLPNLYLASTNGALLSGNIFSQPLPGAYSSAIEINDCLNVIIK